MELHGDIGCELVAFQRCRRTAATSSCQSRAIRRAPAIAALPTRRNGEYITRNQLDIRDGGNHSARKATTQEAFRRSTVRMAAIRAAAAFASARMPSRT